MCPAVCQVSCHLSAEVEVMAVATDPTACIDGGFAFEKGSQGSRNHKSFTCFHLGGKLLSKTCCGNLRGQHAKE
jgi:hypothetical protein